MGRALRAAESVDRGTSNKALRGHKEARCRLHEVVNFELDKGIMSDPEYKKVLERDEERSRRYTRRAGRIHILANFNDLNAIAIAMDP